MKAKYLIGIIILTVLLASCTQSDYDTSPVVIGLKSEPSSLDPHVSKVIWDQFVAYAMFDRLVKYDEKMRVVRSLAEGWSNPDPLTWEVKIRENVKFHNGEPLTTDDVIYSFDRIIEMQTGYYGAFADIDYYEKIDDYNLRIVTKIPYNFVTQFNNIFIVPKDYLEAFGDEHFSKNPVGSGMYKYNSGDTNHISLSLNKDYWGQKNNIENLDIKVVKRDKQFDAILQGEVDVVQDLLPEEYDKLKDLENIDTFIGHSNLFHYLGMKIDDASPLSEINVRKAIAYAIDIDEINALIFSNNAYPASQLGDQGVFGYNPEIELKARDLIKANKLMNASGYSEGFDVTIHTPLGVRYEVGKMVAHQLSDININATVIEVEDKAFWKELFKENHSYSMFIGGFSVGSIIDHTLDTLFYTKNDEGHGKYNFFNYSNHEVDTLLDKAAITNDFEEKGENLMQANKMILDDTPIVPLYSMPRYYGINKKISWDIGYSSQMRLENIRLVDENTWFEEILNIFR